MSKIICPKCHGSGYQAAIIVNPKIKMFPCRVCNGKGKITKA